MSEPRSGARAPASVTLREGPQVVGRTVGSEVVVAHPSVSANHARLTRSGDVVEIEDLDSRYGTFVNDTRVVRARAATGDRIRFGHSPEFRFSGGALHPLVAGAGGDGAAAGALTVEGVSIVRGARALLRDVAARFPRATLTAVVGPSGSGKSLLLGCLGATVELSSGRVEFDGSPVGPSTLDAYRRRVGLVPQADVAFETLTVEENLDYAARVRLPSDSDADRAAAIARALENAGLAARKGTVVDALSGGERKRVAVAVELLRTPEVLLLDEPLSGLDPGTAVRILDVLRRLARQGMTVVATTHDMDTLRYFDRVVAVGNRGDASTVVFEGEPHGLLAQFGAANSAELFEKLKSAGDGSGRTTTAGSSAVGSRRERRYRDSAREAVREIVASKEGLALSATVLRRTASEIVRDRRLLFLSLIQPALLAVVSVLGQARGEKKDPLAVQFFLVVCSVWSGMTLSVRQVVGERATYLRDRRAGLPPLAYVVGKLAFCAAAGAVVAASVVVAGRLSTFAFVVDDGAREGVFAVPFLGEIVVQATAAFAGGCVAIMLSTSARTEQAAVAMLPLALFPMIIFSRLACGAMSPSWANAAAPLPAVADLLRSFDASAAGVAQNLLSLPLVTRPATAVLNMLGSGGDASSAMIFAESVYLTAVVAAYALAAILHFMACERRWSTGR